ncbi:MAG TPA: TlpA disulfide reductase family protein, partial [Bryobacteraceae bacterium]|nr:TlpA disulfide reductase family protein [Bryobacteraceae bacterium]
DWPVAERYGEAVMEEIDAGRIYSRISDAAEEERMRRLYAAALDHQGKAEAADRQIAIVDPGAVTTDAIRAAGAAVAAAERARRIANLRSEVLAAEIHQPAAPFRLRDLNGHEIGLADYLGKPLVALFWATWCEPCIAELRQWNGFFEKFPGLFAAVSIEAEPQTAARFAAKQGYRFPILFADSATERAYTPSSTLNGGNIPQLYVFDSRGNIRFHVIGFDDDGMLAEKVGWMVEEVLKTAPK